jgi:hypothetical protein
MGIIIRFPKRGHVRASAVSLRAGARAASSTKMSAVKPFAEARGVARIADHHSSGILSRWSHLRTLAAGAPIMTANSPGDRHKAITSRNEENDRMSVSGLISESSLGQSVLNGKDILSYDCGEGTRDNAGMSKSGEEAALISRTRLAREIKFHTQKPVYTFLGVPQDTYKHWETGRPIPTEYIPKFCLITECDMAWLLSGEGVAPSLPNPDAKDKRKRRGRKAA